MEPTLRPVSAGDSLINEVVERVLAASRPERIVLFGSRARGTASADSDIDLLVIERVPHRRAHATRLRSVLRGLGVAVDVLVATPEDIERYRDAIGLIYGPALREGRTIYERPSA
jgi:predicted nucleotidyltransferase